MYSKFYLFVLFILALNMPLVAYSQSAGIYEKGIDLMNKGKYKDAISLFQAAKDVDDSLSKQCDEKIRECKRLMPKSNYTSPSKSNSGVSYVININKEELHFGAESTVPQTVKVSSSAEWISFSNVNWCKVTKNGDKVSITCDINRSAKQRMAVVTLENEKDSKKVKIVQEGVKAILNIIPEQINIGKEGDIKAIELECNVAYEIEQKPEWVEVMSKDSEKIIIEVAEYKFPKGVSVRQNVLSVRILGGTSDTVIIAQHNKKNEKVESEEKAMSESRDDHNEKVDKNNTKKTIKIGGRKSVFRNKK